MTLLILERKGGAKRSSEPGKGSPLEKGKDTGRVSKGKEGPGGLFLRQKEA